MKKFLSTAFLVVAFFMMFLSITALVKDRMEYATIFTVASMVALIIVNVVTYIDVLGMEKESKSMKDEFDGLKKALFPQENQADYIKKVLDSIPYAARAEIQKQNRENESALGRDVYCIQTKLGGYTDDEIVELYKCGALPKTDSGVDYNRLKKISSARGVCFKGITIEEKEAVVENGNEMENKPAE